MHRFFKQFSCSIFLAVFLITPSFHAMASEDTTSEPESTVIVESNTSAIDFGGAQSGYVLVRYTGSTNKKVKALVTKEGASRSYIVPPGQEWVRITLTEGDGPYTISLHEQAYGTTYYDLQRISINVAMQDPLAPFLISSIQVNYVDAPSAVTAAEISTVDCITPGAKADAIQDYVVSQLSYEVIPHPKDYICNLEMLLAGKRGACADYAALMCGMLRSQGIPAKMVYGYVSTGGYHAWVMAYIDGKWVRYDPTFYDAMDRVTAEQYITNDANYIPTKTY